MRFGHGTLDSRRVVARERPIEQSRRRGDKFELLGGLRIHGSGATAESTDDGVGALCISRSAVQTKIVVACQDQCVL